MWLTVLIFNPLDQLALARPSPGRHREVPHDLMARMSLVSAGPALPDRCLASTRCWCCRALVLTSYVGVTGLVRRMSLDQCLPQVLLH